MEKRQDREGEMENKYNRYSHYNNYNSYKPYQGRSGGYKSQPVFIQATVIYDFTVEFCGRYISKKSRILDQMVQAARSGKQNIAEGYLQKSLESKLKLLTVARASFEELLQDYQDFLRQKGLKLWEKDSPKALDCRKIVYNSYNNYKLYNCYKLYLEENPGSAGNAMVCLINQTNQLLDNKIRWVEEKFVKEGGFRENLLKKRLDYRRRMSKE
jgi:restriction system protein